jgi:signal transduction histidine kinase
LFADLIAFHLDAHERLSATEVALLDERRSAELREQFIAVLGHDLRNPLAAISAGATLLRDKVPSDGKVRSILIQMQNSVGRMAELIDNVLDFARARLGTGLSVDRVQQPLGPTLEQVIEEMRAAWPNRVIDAHLDLGFDVSCDCGRIAQLFSNLLANALVHGAADGPVRVTASTTSGFFVLVVSNIGEPMSSETLEHLFQPFYRAKTQSNQHGLGLGLYIASEIARAHGGIMDVRSTPEATSFTLRIPLG